MKKFLLLLCTLLGTVGAWADVLSLTPSNGTYVTSSSNYVNSITFNTTPAITVTASANNMDKRQTSTYLLWHSGQIESSTYTISVTGDYAITGYSVTGEANTSAQTLTAGSNSHEFAVGTSSSFEVTGLSSSAVSFVQTGANSSGLKITSISVTVQAVTPFDPSDVAGKTFTMRCARGYVYWNGSAMKGNASNATKFAIVSYDNNTYLFDATNNAFVCHTTAATAGNNGNPALESTSDFSKVVKNISFGSTDIAAYPYYVQEDQFTNWLNMDGNPNVYFNRWTDFESGNGGNTYKIEVVDTDFDQTAAVAMLEAYFNPSATVTYVISDGSGVIHTSEAFSTTVGATISSLPADLQRPYCTYNVTSATMVAGSNTVNATVTYNPPFTVSSSFETATWYYAKLRGSKFVRADENHKDGSGRYQTNTTNEKTDVYKWAFVGNPYNLAVMNKGAGSTKYLNANNNTAPSMMDATPASDIKARWIAVQNSNGSFALRSESGANLYINDAGGGGNLGFWNSSAATSDAGSNWVIEEALPVCEVTYTYTYGGKNYSSTELQTIGDAVSLPADITFPYTNYTFDTQTVPDAASATVNVTVAGFDMPFEASTDFASATWYYLHVHASYNDRYVSTNSTSIVFSQGEGVTEAYQWAFIGNPIEGIKIINKAAGDGNYLMATDPATMGTTEKAWSLKKQTNTTWQCGANGFGFYDATLTYLNPQQGTLKYWGSFDQGSTFWVTAVPDNYASNVEAEIKPWFDNYGGNFQLKTSVVEANQNKYEAALVNCDLATYEELLALLDEANNYVYPETGYYRIKSIGARAVGESYIAYGKSSGSSSYGLITKAATAANQDATTVFYINKQSNSKYTLAIQGLNVQAASQSTIVSATSAAAPEFTFIPSSPGYAEMTVNGGQYEFLHESGWTEQGFDYNAVLGWTAAAGASQWTVEPVSTLSVALHDGGDGNNYATLCVPFAFTESTNAVNTLALDADGHTLNATPVSEVAAGTPVLLQSTSPSVTLTLASGYAADPADPVSGTALTGTYVAKTINGASDYVLGTFDSKVGFYHWDSNNLAANRAYVAGNSGPNNVKGFYLNFDATTGISGIDKREATDGQYYDLSGRRVAQPARGLYIVNGKKVAVK